MVSSYKDLTRKIELDLNWSFTISTTCIRTNCHKTSQPTGEISFGDSHFWEKNPAKTKRETYLLSLYGKLVGWKLSLSPEVMSEGPDAGSAEQPKKKWCDDRKQWGKWGKGDDFFGDFQRKIACASTILVGWMSQVDRDRSINQWINQSIVIQLIGSTTRLRELHSRECDEKPICWQAIHWAFGKYQQIWKDSVPLNIYYPPNSIGIINLLLNHLGNDHGEQLHPCNPMDLGALILARISNFADLPSSNESSTEEVIHLRFDFREQQIHLGKNKRLLSCT